MKNNNRKKNRGLLKAHVGHMIHCSEWNKGRSVKFEGFTSDGRMKVTDIWTKATHELPDEYLDKEWKFG